MNRALLFMASVVVVVGSVACGSNDAVDVGQTLFADPRFSDDDFNAFSCATCHADGSDDAVELIRPGHSLVDTVQRPSWWGGHTVSLKDAVDDCLFFFMRDQPMDPNEAKSRALYEYLRSISSTSPQPALPLSIVENVTTVPRGDPGRGERVYAAACATCHGDKSTGAGRLTELASIVPDDSVDFAASSGFSLETVIIEKVRHGAFFAIGGTMPPFSREALSDEDLGALIAYLVPAP
ncbi:MAG TPA: c-type cytochrome [Myxococcota bacterium]